MRSESLVGILVFGTPNRFENRQKTSYVDFALNNGNTPDKPLIDSTLGGVALFDFDNDGFLDIFFTNGARIPTLEKDDPAFYNRLYRNNRDGTFTGVTERAGLQGGGYSMGVAAADFDNDGWTDLYLTGVNRNILYHNNGDGTYSVAKRTHPDSKRYRRRPDPYGEGKVMFWGTPATNCLSKSVTLGLAVGLLSWAHSGGVLGRPAF